MLLILDIPTPAKGMELDTDTCAQKMIQYYLAYEDRAEAEIEALLNQMNDPWLEEKWRGIIEGWSYCNYRYKKLSPRFARCNRYCGLLLHGSHSDDSASRYEAFDNRKGKKD